MPMLADADVAYADGIDTIVTKGDLKPSRVGPTLSYPGLQLRCDLRDGFPLLQFKKTAFRAVHVELAWFLKGGTNVKWLQDRNVRIWDDDAAKVRERGLDYPEGELGPIYGKQWREWTDPAGGPPIDQIARLIADLKASPASRRHVVSAWNPADVPKMGLPPCHCLFQVLCTDDGFIDLLLTMRSGDYGLGIPFNMASYALLLTLLARETGRVERHLVITINDAHIYQAHLDALTARHAEAAACGARNAPRLLLPPEIDSVAAFVQAHDDPAFAIEVDAYRPFDRIKLPLLT